MPPDFFHGALEFYIFNVAKYFIIAGGFFLVFYVYFPDKFKNNKIQPKHTSKKADFIREIYHSNQSLIISIFIIPVILFTPLYQYTEFTFSFTRLPHNLSMWWSPVIFLAVLILHDAYFYWIHWLMHKPKLYKRFHLVHHKSYDPTSLATLSFNYTEAILELAFNIIILFIIPLDLSIMFIFGLTVFTFHSYVHLGYEIMPLSFRNSFLFKIMVTSTHHNIHHSKSKYNFGLYFRFWDRLMKTEYPKYEEVYDEIQARRLSNQ
jgi:sterol desaturase/sphingolipid hydroxylase (fatty acid hydroxylase superfamily)